MSHSRPHIFNQHLEGLLHPKLDHCRLEFGPESAEREKREGNWPMPKSDLVHDENERWVSRDQREVDNYKKS